MVLLPLATLFFACNEPAVPSHPASDHGGGSPFAAASGVTRPGERPANFKIIPLAKMTGDVEILYGDPEKPVPFAMRIRELPGTIIPLHTHPVDEHITILQGTWYFSVGDKWDKAALKALHAGDYAFAAKGSTRFGYCHDGAVVQVSGIGPFLIDWKHGSKTLDDADASRVFTFRRGERIDSPMGRGVIRNGYASGDIIQYEIEGENGNAFMASQSEMKRR
jgi:quercetin dioxygenase-like cupin family protein